MKRIVSMYENKMCDKDVYCRIYLLWEVQLRKEMPTNLRSMDFEMSNVVSVGSVMVSQCFTLSCKMYDTMSVSTLPSATVNTTEMSTDLLTKLTNPEVARRLF